MNPQADVRDDPSKQMALIFVIATNCIHHILHTSFCSSLSASYPFIKRFDMFTVDAPPEPASSVLEGSPSAYVLAVASVCAFIRDRSYEASDGLVLCTFQIFMHSSTPTFSINFTRSIVNFQSHLHATLTEQVAQENRPALFHSTLLLTSVLSNSPSASSARGGSRGRYSEENYGPEISREFHARNRERTSARSATSSHEMRRLRASTQLSLRLLQCELGDHVVIVRYPSHSTRMTYLQKRQPLFVRTRVEACLLAKSPTTKNVGHAKLS